MQRQVNVSSHQQDAVVRKTAIVMTTTNARRYLQYQRWGLLERNLPTGANCDDNNACTENDGCLSLRVRLLLQLASVTIFHADGDQCTKDGCDALTGCVHVLSEGELCLDGDACVFNEVCQSNGDCVGTLPIVTTGKCTVDACGDNQCQYQDLPEQTPCDDGDACNDKTADVCIIKGDNLICYGGANNCDDGDDCTADSCVDFGCVHEETTGNACDDGNACTNFLPVTMEIAYRQPSTITQTAATWTTNVTTTLVTQLQGVISSKTGQSHPDGDLCNIDDTCSAAGVCVGPINFVLTRKPVMLRAGGVLLMT